MIPLHAHNLPAHELIGLKVRVKQSADPLLEGVLGTVRDETMNTLIIETFEKMLRVPKSSATFEFELPSGETTVIDGTALQFRPEDRVKKAKLKW